MLEQIPAHLAIRVDQRVHRLGMRRRLLPRRCTRDHRLQVQFVRIQEQADERHLVVRLVADVADDHDARMSRELVYVRGGEHLCTQSHARKAKQRQYTHSPFASDLSHFTLPLREQNPAPFAVNAFWS
jgi:hypothetical protein